VTVILGDCLSVMKTMPDNSIDAFVEDPPSGIAFMNMHWDKDKGGRDRWIEWLTEIMQEQLRIAKPGAHMLCWALPRTSHWTATAIRGCRMGSQGRGDTPVRLWLPEKHGRWQGDRQGSRGRAGNVIGAEWRTSGFSGTLGGTSYRAYSVAGIWRMDIRRSNRTRNRCRAPVGRLGHSPEARRRACGSSHASR
jgi:hypothetical protein